eukprot:TRINITY_DN11474_c1_g1_i1.p1 TRINITY_DN11474_c1_g1~~TRINITY_DN11474_c1_g1_i1.p1  ORF type:complete len:285 (-),score=16.40 TRINITY_DN11474_c1_g1_i1:59-913(-)
MALALRRVCLFFELIYIVSALGIMNRKVNREPSADLPRNGRVAILVRGESFRKGRHTSGCNSDADAQAVQLRSTQSLISGVIRPLEELGNKVEIVATDKSCSLTPALLKLLERWVLKFETVRGEHQGDNMRAALQLFKATLDPVQYDLVFVVRHDEVFHVPINYWGPGAAAAASLDITPETMSFLNANFSKMNFFSRCQLRAGEAFGGDLCVYDLIHIMPGRLFPAFDATIGSTPGCFFTDPVGNGHNCYRAMSQAMETVNGEVGVISTERKWARGKNHILDLV